MRDSVDEKVKVPYGSGKIELEVIGVWKDDMIISAKVRHGAEYISPVKYDSLFLKAVTLAERMHRAYLEDQQAAIIYRILGY